ncbi:MAG: DUF4358 domain-containing protein [Clostridia bacterium]|nr:DUF4358 domain-containing protein [Clostridia bacterium]
MKKWIIICWSLLLLVGCTAAPVPEVQLDPRAQATSAPTEPVTTPEPVLETAVPEETEAPLPEETEVPSEATLSDRVAAAWEDAGYLSDLVQYSDMDLLDLYGIDLTACKSGIGFADAVGYTNEALVIEAEETMAAEIESLLKTHLETVKNQFRSYDPEALKLAEDAVLLRDGGVVVMIVSPLAEEMLAAYRSVNR